MWPELPGVPGGEQTHAPQTLLDTGLAVALITSNYRNLGKDVKKQSNIKDFES